MMAEIILRGGYLAFVNGLMRVRFARAAPVMRLLVVLVAATLQSAGAGPSAHAEGPTALAHPPAGLYAHPALLVLLHGSGADERDMIGLWRQLPGELLVVSPRAPFAGGGGYRWYRQGEERAADIAASLALIDAVIDGAVARFGADPARVFVGGFSQGGVMSYEAALRAPRRFRGALVLSGSLFATLLPAARAAAATGARVPFFIGHGSADGRIPLSAGLAARNTLKSLGEPVAFHEYAGLGHGTSDAEIADAAAWLAERLKKE